MSADHGNIYVARSDGRCHDLSVLSGPTSNYLEKVSAEVKSAASDSELHPEAPIYFKRSDGDAHDIVKVMKGKSEVGCGTFKLSDSLKSFTRRFSGKDTMIESNVSSQNPSEYEGPDSCEKLPSPMVPSRAPVPVPGSVRIVHMSDTFNMLCRTSPTDCFLPAGDILIHSGNFSLHGQEEEYQQFDGWLESISFKYPYRVVCLGNNDVRKFGHTSTWNELASKLPHATHVLCHQEVTILGIRIFGSPWYWGHHFDYSLKSGAAPINCFRDIPEGVHILVTNGPAHGRLDRRRSSDNSKHDHCGSAELSEAIRRAKPGCHLHGHTTDDRGVLPAENHSPLIVNSAMCDRDGTVMYSCPHVIVAKRIFAPYIESVTATSSGSSPNNDYMSPHHPDNKHNNHAHSSDSNSSSHNNSHSNKEGNNSYDANNEVIVVSSSNIAGSSSSLAGVGSPAILWDFRIGSLVATS